MITATIKYDCWLDQSPKMQLKVCVVLLLVWVLEGIIEGIQIVIDWLKMNIEAMRPEEEVGDDDDASIESFLERQSISVNIEHRPVDIGPNLVKTVRQLGAGRNARVELVEHQSTGTRMVVKIFDRLNFRDSQTMLKDYRVLARAAPNCREIV